MKTLLFALLVVCVSTLLVTDSHAQSNYRPGFIITVQKDTVYGQIDFRTDKMNARRCVFRSGDDVEERTYYPFDILGYRFTDDGKYYISKSVELTRNGSPLSVFLEYLLQGMKSLYYYESEDDEPIYFIENGDKLIKVDAPYLSKKTDGFQSRGQTDRYVPILHYAFGDCPSIGSKIDQTRYNHKELIALAKEYHKAMCTSNEDCIEFETKVNKRTLQLHFTPYVGIVQYRFSSGNSTEFFSKPDLSYLFGVNLALNSERWMSSLSFSVDFSLSRLMAYEKGFNAFNNEYYDIKYSGMMFSSKLGIGYTYPKGMVRPFVGFGMNLNAVLSSKCETPEESEEWINDVFPGYYLNAGVKITVSKKMKQAISMRIQFEDVRDVIEKTKFVSAWSGVVGYTF